MAGSTLSLATRFSLVAALTLAACSSAPGTDDGATDDASPHAADAGSTEPRVGRVRLHHYEDLSGPRAGSFARAEFGVGGLPSRHAEERLTAVMAIADCRLLERQPPMCDPPCLGDFWCLADGTCRYTGHGLDAGTVTIEESGDSIELQFELGYLLAGDVLALEPGAEIDVRAPGGSWVGGTAAGFEIAGVAPEEFDVAIAEGVLALDREAPTVLSWTPSAREDARYALRIATAYGHGGSSEHLLACDGPDRGEVVIAPEIVAAFPALEVPNCVGLTCVMATLERFTLATATTVDGVVTLEIGASRSFWARNEPPPGP